jgi:hypothetical protein
MTLHNPASAPARAYLDATKRLLGETIPLVVAGERKGLMNQLLGRKHVSALEIDIELASGIENKFAATG